MTAAREALERGLDWLAALRTPPRFEARAEGHSPVLCDAPYAVALVATAWRAVASARPAPPALADWLASACDPDGLVRFFGPASPIIRPDLDDTAMVWAERRALTGWSPPKSALEAALSSRVEGGAFNTWPTVEGGDPLIEVDAVVNANILGMLAADGRVDAPAHQYVDDALAGVGGPRPPTCLYYPDLAMLVVCARRAEELGAGPFTYPALTALDAETWLGQVARALLDDPAGVDGLVASQEADGGWPWAPLFIGGEENVFPDGQRLTRPWYGHRATSTALAVMALARHLGLRTSPLAPGRGPHPVRRAQREPWEALLGPLGHGVTLVRRQGTSSPYPELESADGTLRVDLAPRHTVERSFRASAHWAVGYRGDRGPTAAEVAAMERLIALMDAEGPASAPTKGPAGITCHAADASDLSERLKAVDASTGPVHVRLPSALDVPSALPHLADALRAAEGGDASPELRFEGLPFCALPWPEDLVMAAAPSAPRRPLAPTCDRCVMAHACPGPAGGELRPRTSSGPWVPLARAAEAWRATWGFPRRAAWEPIAAALHDLQGGPLSGVPWSIVLVADVADGRVDPTFRVDAFHGQRDGRVQPGRPVLERLTTLDPGVRAALTPAAETCPIHPAFSDGPAGSHLGAYVDTGHLTPDAAWRLLRASLDAASLPLEEAAPEGLSILGYAAAPGPEPIIDVYLTVPATGAPPHVPPEAVTTLAAGGHCVATLRLREGRLHLRKWDVPWWRAGRDDEALLSLLAPGGAEHGALTGWLHDPRFGLHPTTLGWREGGRRIYLRVC